MYITFLSSLDTPGEVRNASCERNYSFDTLTTLWDPLPTLDLTDIEPDVLYTVELLKITCGQNVSMNKTVVARNSTTMENLDLMQIYKTVVVASNNVIGAKDGPSVEMEGIVLYIVIIPTSWCFIINHALQRSLCH